MRFRDIFWIVFSLLLVVVIGSWIATGIRSYQLETDVASRADSRRVLTNLLHDDRWVEFHVPADARSIRVSLNAALSTRDKPSQTLTDPRGGWRYVIEYQLTDGRGAVIEQAPYHLRSGIRELVDSDTGELIDPLVFGKTSLIAAQTRIIQLPLGTKPEQSRPTKIRIRTKERDPEVAEVVARVFTQQERPRYKDRSTWKHISSKTRRQLARFCVFDQKFLTRSEQTSLLRWQWEKALPVTSPTIRYLYFVGDIDDQEVGQPALPTGVSIEPGWRSTVPVPAAAGELRLVFERADSSSPNAPFVNVSWSRNAADPPFEDDIEITGDTLQYKLPLDGGIVEVQTSEPVSYQSYWTNLQAAPVSISDSDPPLEYGQEVELSHAVGGGSVRVYLADQNAVQYSISHLDDQPTAFRLSARLGFGEAFLSEDSFEKEEGKLGQAEVWSVSKNLRWEYLDELGNPIDAGELMIEPEVSPYDRLWKMGKPHLVSEKRSFYFSIPVQAKAIRLSSQEPFLVSGSVRPYDLPWVTRVPEDLQSFERRNRRNRKWFTLRPNSHFSLIANNRGFMLSTESRVGLFDEDDETEETLAPDQYVWQRYEPEGDWIGRQVLVPAAEENEIRLQSLEAYFFEVQPNRTYKVEDFDFRTNESYQLRYISAPTDSTDSTTYNKAKEGWVKVWLNGQLVQEKRLTSARGKIPLNIKNFGDAAELRFECSQNVKLFFSGADLAGAARYLKRTACRLEQGTLTFPYHKASADLETLTLSIYRTAKSGSPENARCQLDVRIEADQSGQMGQPSQSSPPSQLGQLNLASPVLLTQTGPVEHLTALHRIFDLKTMGAMDQKRALLLGADTPLDIEHKCFIQLGPDLPPGDYKITTTRMDGDRNGFVLLHQLRPKEVLERDYNANKFE